MRKILIASLAAAGVALLAGSSGSAAPVNNTALTKLKPLTDETLQQVGGGWRHRCHVRWRSWWHRC